VLNLPPLSERREDIPEIIRAFRPASGGPLQTVPHPWCPAGQMHRLMAHSWPGNVRELAQYRDRFVLGILGNDDSIFSASGPEEPLAHQVRPFRTRF